MSSYSCLAHYYDRLMGDFDYQGYLQKLNLLEGTEGVDLCCGSGKIAIALAKAGKKITGVDLSPDMLNEARNNARKEGVNITLVNCDICKFMPPHKVDFVTCVCDGINYIAPKKLDSLFATVAGFIKDRGQFVFDISSQYKLKKILGNNEFFEEYDDLTYLWSNKFSKDKLNMSLSFFVKQKDNAYLKFTEEHTQYAHSQQIIENALSPYFDFKAYDFDGFCEIKNTTSRIVWVCVKK